jgi:hypothetical protein
MGSNYSDNINIYEYIIIFCIHRIHTCALTYGSLDMLYAVSLICASWFFLSFAYESFNPLPVQFKSLLHGQEGCVFFSGHLNLRTCRYVWVHLARQATFKSSTFWYVRARKGLNLLWRLQQILHVLASSMSYTRKLLILIFLSVKSVQCSYKLQGHCKYEK